MCSNDLLRSTKRDEWAAQQGNAEYGLTAYYDCLPENVTLKTLANGSHYIMFILTANLVILCWCNYVTLEQWRI